MDLGEIKIVNGRIVMTPACGTVWLTKHQIADLFGCFVSKVSSNISAILKSGVLEGNKVCRLYPYKNGNTVELYNLEMITALAFRIKSKNADIFRQWLMGKAVQRPSEKRVPVFISWNEKSLLN